MLKKANIQRDWYTSCPFHSPEVDSEFLQEIIMSEKKSVKDSSKNQQALVVKCPHCGASFTTGGAETQISTPKIKKSSLGIWVVVIVILLFVGWLITPRPKTADTHNHDAEVADSGSDTGGTGTMPAGHPPIKGGMEGMMGGTTPGAVSSEMPGGHPAVEGGEQMPEEIMQKFTALKQKVEANPKDTDSLKELGNMYYDIGWADKAIEYYGKYLAIIPDDSFVLNDMGRMYIAADDLGSAIKNLNRSVELNPTLPQPFINLGLAYAGQGKYEEALSVLEKAVAVSTDQAVTDGAKSLMEQVKTAIADEQKKTGQ
jgi:hypothetical protein